MTKQMCINGTLDDAMYSSPVPVIGLYIAGASLVCFLGMLYDIFCGIRSAKTWLPCRLFSLNSVTLTLLAIATKIPVDLTTQMPSARDQISKLSGTTLICVSMCFLMPSLGTNKNSECLTNMASLSIFVVTVVVNICIQIRTGVIFTFIVEHIIVMCCMLLLLMLLWFSASLINSEKDFSIDLKKDMFAKGEGSMFQRLKFAYLYGYVSNPQFQLCKHHSTNPNVAILCMLSFVVLVQAMFRSQRLEFCGGVSDYDWSMCTIVVTQILTIILGSFSSCFRWFAVANLLSEGPNESSIKADAVDEVYMNPLLKYSAVQVCGGLLKCFISTIVSGLALVVLPLWIGVLCLRRGASVLFKSNKLGDLEEYKHLISIGGLGMDEWSLSKSVKDMKRWMEACQIGSLNHLSKLLSAKLPSQQVLTMDLKDQLHPNEEGIQVSSFSVALLVIIAQVSIPADLSGALVKTFKEISGVIQFIDERINTVSRKSRLKSKFGQAVSVGSDFSGYEIARLFNRFTSNGKIQTLSDFDRALLIIKQLKNILLRGVVRDEVIVITDFITRRDYSSIGDLYDYVEQMFVNMIHKFLAQLPHAIYKEVTRSTTEDFDESVRLALKLLCKVELVEAQIQWSFPVGCNISSLITTQVPNTQSRTDTLEAANEITHVTEYAGNNV